MKKLNFYMFLLVITLIMFQQMPLIKELMYDQLRVVLYIFIGIILAFKLPNIFSNLKNKFINKFLLVICYSLILYSSALFLVGYSGNILEFIIPFSLLIISYNSQLTNNQKNIIIIVYVLLACCVGIANVLYYVGNFNITLLYEIPFKNQIGPIIGIAAVISLVYIVYNYHNKNRYVVIFIVTFIFLLLSLLVIRNRASIVGIFIIVFLLFAHKFFKELSHRAIKLKYRTFFLLLSFGFLVVIGWSVGFLQLTVTYIWDSLTMNYNTSDFDSLSAGRFDVYLEAITYTLRHPFLGEVFSSFSFNSTPHNYILNKWVRYGLLGSLPIVIFYLYLWIYGAREIVKALPSINLLAIWILIFSLTISLFEYTYPFGPGVSQFFLWYLLGQYLRRDF